MTDTSAVVLFGLSLFSGAALAVAALVSRRATRRLDRRPALAALTVAAIAMGVSAGLGLIRVPTPFYHDEYSYLLAADTFAHGRLTNPAPPLPEHFEAMHILTTPGYVSKYPPGQGLTLALGQVLFHMPIVGAWLTFAAACAALHWALCATLPRRFALFGALLVALHPLIHGDSFHSWTQSFWGGQVALLGGALLIGAATRLAKRARPLDGLACGAGLGILALSRPMEGLVAAAMVSIIPIRAWLRGSAPGWRDWARRAAPPAALAVGVALGFQALLNHRVTGSPLTMPHLLYESRYATVQPLVWMPAPSTKTFPNETMREFYEDDILAAWKKLRTPAGFAAQTWERTRNLWLYFAWPVAAVWLGLPLALRRWRARHLAYLLLATFVWVLNGSWLHPHYVAVFVPFGVELAARSARELACLEGVWRWLGRAAVAVLIGYICWVLSSVAWDSAHKARTYARSTLLEQLEDTGEKHLVFVDRQGTWNIHHDWAYNGADMENAPVVWARSIDDAHDAELIRKFPGRSVWRLVLGNDVGKMETWKSKGK